VAELLRKSGKFSWARNEKGTENEDNELQSSWVFITLNNEGLTFNTSVGIERIQSGLRFTPFMVLPLQNE
jgi:hypothetical protein